MLLLVVQHLLIAEIAQPESTPTVIPEPTIELSTYL
jgi:hypothetical protein